MSYTINIPLATDDPSQSQSQFFNNFNVLNTSNSVNHVAFNATGQGKHTNVELVNQSSFTGISGEGTLNTQASGGISDLYYTPDATGDQYRMTRVNHAFRGTLAQNPGWTFLPGGLQILYGTVAPTSSTTVTINFAALGLPNFALANYNIQVTRQRTTSDPGSSFEYYVDNTTVATTGFSIINRDGHTYGYYWMAIGF